MTTRERYRRFIEYFSTHMSQPETELHYSNPYELTVAVSLSAQCTDKRVNAVTPFFFQAFPTPQALAVASEDQVFDAIKSISYPNSKTKNLIGMARMLVYEYGGQLPDSLEQLTRLPGVGRKTANVLLSVLYHKPAMAVDTHVFRVSKRLGLVPLQLKTPEQVEKVLVKNIAQKYIPHAHHWLILHGRYVCTARSPKCDQCHIKSFCLYFEYSTKGKTFQMEHYN